MIRGALVLFLCGLVFCFAACAGPTERGDRWRPDEASGTTPDEEFKPISVGPPKRPDPASRDGADEESGPLALDAVLASVETHFPDLLAAAQEIERAEGLLLEAEGGFDATLSGKGVFERGFYETEDFSVEVRQPLATGGATVFGGYRFGFGNFASYDGDIITNDGGEFRVGAILPLLQNSAIDARRAAVWRARIERDAAEPAVQQKRIAVARKASLSYWKWVAAVRKLEVARGLLALAEGRKTGLKEEVKEGESARIDIVDNERLIVQRRGIVVAAQREVERSAILLSLYLRDAKGDPLRPTVQRLPARFPEPPPIRQLDLDAHIVFGLRHRPELARLGALRSQMQLDEELGENQLLPEFDLSVFASQDLGGSSDSKGSLDPLKYGFGISMKVPLQRRKARGKLQQVRAKLAKVSQKIRLQGDEIETQVRDAASAFHRARAQLSLSRETLALTVQMEEAERFRVGEGQSDLLRLNLREQSTAKARSKVIEAEAGCFAALANYRAAMGLPRPDVDVGP